MTSPSLRDLRKIMDHVLKIFEPRIKEKKLKLILQCEDGASVIMGDSFKLEQMFVNLIDNAVKYTDQGKIQISIKKADANIRVSIRDTGIGIPKKHLSRIFERFYVVDKSRSRTLGGTGLGLSIVKHIVFLHDGSMSVDSEPGKGTTFIIDLPA